ncbi:FtsW/RodA/SpoVE family cell cycle protein, partial [Patescibacteria group bacterium]|nr:FtsW/RodA/SpoVE family cell cycle protein [Patescibacteria group bacterium]
MRKIRLKKQSKKLDKNLFIVTLLLTVLGLVAVADASAPIALSTFSDEFYFLKQQAVWGVLGLILLVVISRIHYSFWEKLAVPIFIASTVTLILVLVPQLGARLLGARRWLVFGPVSFQPSEFAKLALALYLAKVASKDKVVLSYLLPIGLFGGLIMMQPDLGTTIVVSTIGLAQLFVAGLPLLSLLGVVSAGG